METLFLFSALIGGTFLLCQFGMTLLGLDDGPDQGDIDTGGDLHSDGALGGDEHHSSWLFGIISFRTLVAAATFFGLTGMFMIRSGAELRDQLLVAIASGVAALFGVHWMMKTFHQLGQSGTLRTSNAVGKTATVNVSIPANQSGPGKVQLEIQGRLEELAAVTSQNQSLTTGTRVQVVGLQQGNILEVEALPALRAAETMTS